MSFNRAGTGRMTIKVSSSSTKHTMNREIKENISPLVKFGTLKNSINQSLIAESSSTKSQCSRRQERQSNHYPKSVERYATGIRTQKFPLHELKNFKSTQNSRINSNRARSSLNFSSKRNSNFEK